MFENTINVLNEKSRIFNGIFQESDDKKEYKDIFIIFEIFQKFIEKKPEEVKLNFNQFTEILLSYRNTEILGIRSKLGQILINLFQLKFVISIKLQQEIFFFFFNNFSIENYQMNLSSSEFFLFFLENKEEFIKKNLNQKENVKNDITNNNDENDSENLNLIDLFEKYLKE